MEEGDGKGKGRGGGRGGGATSNVIILQRGHPAPFGVKLDAKRAIVLPYIPRIQASDLSKYPHCVL